VRSEADVLKGHERVGSMNVGLRGSTTPKKPGQGGSAFGSRNPDDGTGTLSGVSTLQGAGRISRGGRTPRQITYVVDRSRRFLDPRQNHLPVEVEY
jgi:hypothetical protein